MATGVLLKAALGWLLIAGAETLHGILRVRLLNRRIGDRRARQVGVFSGSAIILALAWWLVPWTGVRSDRDCLVVGAAWLLLMMGFDLGLGRVVFRLPWPRLMAEFDPRQGGFLAFGMLVLFCSPLIIAHVRHFVW